MQLLCSCFVSLVGARSVLLARLKNITPALIIVGLRVTLGTAVKFRVSRRVPLRLLRSCRATLARVSTFVVVNILVRCTLFFSSPWPWWVAPTNVLSFISIDFIGVYSFPSR